MTTPPADEPRRSGFVAPPAEVERQAARVHDTRAAAHGRRAAAPAVELPPIEVPRHPQHDRPRYYLSSLEPSGDFDEVIVAVSHAGRRRYFATRDGARLAEVDERAFEQRSEGGSRSLLELDERELGELEAELQFVRPVRGRDPIAEAEDSADAEAEAEAEAAAAAAAAVLTWADAAEPTDAAEPEPERWIDAAPQSEPDSVATQRAGVASADEDSEGIDDWAEPTAVAGFVAASPAATPDPDLPAYEPIPTRASDPEPAPEPEPELQPEPEPQPEFDPESGLDPELDPEPGLDPETDPEPATPATPDATDAPVAEDDEDWTMEEFEAEMMATTTDPAQPFERIDAEASARVAVAASVAPAVLSTADPTPEVVAVAQVSLARGISFVAHRGRLDKSGLPYVDHPGRVAERFDIVAEHVEAAAAWLHDVLEDTPITAQELLEAGILPEIVDVVRLLTRTPDVSPDEYYARIRSHPSALAVKLADIDDNTAPWRLRRLSYGTQVRLAEKYAYARRALGVD